MCHQTYCQMIFRSNWSYLYPTTMEKLCTFLHSSECLVFYSFGKIDFFLHIDLFSPKYWYSTLLCTRVCIAHCAMQCIEMHCRKKSIYRKNKTQDTLSCVKMYTSYQNQCFGFKIHQDQRVVPYLLLGLEWMRSSSQTKVWVFKNVYRHSVSFR